MQTNHVKIAKAFVNYVNGNKKDAAKSIRSFNRLEIAFCLTRWANINEMRTHLLCDKDEIYNWENFVFNAIDNYI